jgi:hypothetical protein
MPTGACGINCEVCRLQLMGTCSSCGPGKSLEAKRKLDAQRRILGAACSILECAALNKIDYCMRDCRAFPCENFALGPYPFSAGFLDMQERRLDELPPALDWNNRPVKVPEEFWEQLAERDPAVTSNFVLAETDGDSGLRFPFLKADVRIDLRHRQIQQRLEDRWQTVSDPMLTLVTLLYFNRVDQLIPLSGSLASIRDLKGAHFFTGPHELRMSPLLERFGEDPDGFRQAAERLGGQPEDMADAAYRLLPFPRIPLHYLYWSKNEEFDARIEVLFDRSIDRCLTASAIWGLVWRVNVELLRV